MSAEKNRVWAYTPLFEARYGDQIHRYYQDRSRDNLWEPQDPPDWGDMPF